MPVGNPNFSGLVSDVRRRVYGAMTENVNLIEEDAVAGSDVIKLSLGVDGIQKGMMISGGLNVWFVKAIYAANNSVFVIPGYDNSPQDAVSAGDMVYVRPRMTDWFAFNALNDQLSLLSSPENGLYKIGTFTLPVDTTWGTYTVPSSASDMTTLMRVRWLQSGTTDLWRDLKPYQWRWQNSATHSTIRSLVQIPGGTTVEFTYRAPFTKATTLTADPIADCGLAETMLDLPVMGAASSLLMTTESTRTQVAVQGDTRRPEEVANMANQGIGTALYRLYIKRVQQEAIRLNNRVPIYAGV